MKKEVYLHAKTFLRASDMKNYKRYEEDFLVNAKEDGVTEREVKGWIYETHCRYASMSFSPNQPIPVKKTRPQKGVERYTTEVNHGTLETTIVRLEKTIEEPQSTLF